ncbi:unnamed protein product [Prunus armeniaca]
MSRAPLVSTHLPGEDLIIYLSVLASALSSVLIRRPNCIELPIFCMSHALQDAKQRYPQLEQLAYALVLSARRLRPYFQAHNIDVLTNQPLRQVLQKPETSGRLIKWAIELGEFDIRYHPRPLEKGHAVADFILEFTLPTNDGRPIDPVTAPPSAFADPPSADNTFDQKSPHWTLYVDGSSNRQGRGASLVLKTPDDTTIECAICFQFRASNNEAEYEALLAGLRLAQNEGAEWLMIYSDSQLVINQVIIEFAAKDESMAAYLAQTRRLLKRFKTYYICQVPRSENSHADALSRLASAIDDCAGRHVPIEVLTRRSTTEADVNTIRRDPIGWTRSMPTSPTASYQLTKPKPRQYDDDRCSHSLPLLRCVTPQQGDYILHEIHEGACGDHSGS